MYDELKKIEKDLEGEEYTEGAIGYYFACDLVPVTEDNTGNCLIFLIFENYFFHITVDIDSDFEVQSIRIIDGVGVDPFEVTVTVNGQAKKSEIYDFNDIEAVYMSVGP